MGTDDHKASSEPAPLRAPALSASVHPAPSIGPFVRPDVVPGAMTPISEGHYHGEQGMYLAASGTLTQFNAIMAALLTAALSLDVSPAVKAVIGLALAGHAAAGFLLCWAARPIASADGAPRLTADRLLLRSLINYRRGWRATMLALTLSALALAVLAWQQLGPEILSLLR
jgi:hypothetical protein